MVTQAEIARLAGIDVSSVSKILNRVQGPIFREETIRKVFQLAHELGFTFEQLKHRTRKDERKKAGFPSELALYAPDGSLIDRGHCTVADIAIGGASITEIELVKGRLPLRPLTVTLDFMSNGSPIEVRGQVVRMNETNGSLSLGIAFQDPGPAVVEKIAAVGG
jgi:transcriptional regulator with XRE-family HTH domain